MKSREPRKPRTPSVTDATPPLRRSWHDFGLLELVPEFQKDVTELRIKYSIPSQGFVTDDEKSKIGYDNYDLDAESKANVLADENLKKLGDFHRNSLPNTPEPKKKEFQIDIEKLGDKFRLPYYFYHSSLYGLAWYVLRNRVAMPDRRWEIIHDPIDESRNVKVRYAMLRVYQPLTEDEAEEAFATLNNTLKELQPESFSTQHRIHSSTERNLAKVSRMIECTRGDPNWLPKTSAERELLRSTRERAIALFGFDILPQGNSRS